MKIKIISSKKQVSYTMQGCVKKLNSMLIDNVNFFTYSGDEIIFGGCANSEYHNKLLAIITLLLPYEVGYQRLGDKDRNYFRISDVNKFGSILDTLPDKVSDIVLEIF